MNAGWIQEPFFRAKNFTPSSTSPTQKKFSTRMNRVAIGESDALSAHGIQFPRDYSIVGFDNLLYTGLSRISLTTVDHHTDILAQAAISLLLRRVDPSMETPFQ